MNLLTLSDIASTLDLSYNYVRDTLVKRADFPRPTLSLSQKCRRWAKGDFEAWLTKSHADLAR